MRHRRLLTTLLTVVTTASAVVCLGVGAPAGAAVTTFTSGTAWRWVYADLPATTRQEQFVQATVDGNSTADQNGALLLRKSASAFLMVNFSGTRYQVSAVTTSSSSAGESMVDVVDLPLPGGGGHGVARAEVSGSTIKGYWRGALINISTDPRYGAVTGSQTGLGLWQDRPSTVTLSALSSGDLNTPSPVVPSPVAPSRRAVPPVARQRRPTPSPMSRTLFGATQSGLPWHSGFWTGGQKSTARMLSAAQWRGRAFDVATTYPSYGSWAELRDSDWAVGLFDGFKGRLSYGLPLLPRDRAGQWGDITSGAHDDVFRTIARQLVAHGKGNSAVRVGLEANGSWFPWSVTAATAPQYKASFRRVVQVMRSVAPHLTFWFDTAAGTPMDGAPQRMDALTRIYPGDDVVNGISMDHFDFYGLTARTAAQWRAALSPAPSAGLADGMVFARRHKKGFAVPEWGVHDTQGAGDNPFFIQQMHDFFMANRDTLVYECYFNEADPYIRSALWDAAQNPRSAALYRRLF